MSLTKYGPRTSGAESWKVDEHPGAADAVLVAEFEAWSELRVLLPGDLRAGLSRHTFWQLRAGRRRNWSQRGICPAKREDRNMKR